jgi:hypothetical protein
MQRSIPWLRIAAEGAAILVSILLAFAIQAWWDGTRDGEEEDRLIEAVLSDTQANRIELETALAYHTAAGEVSRSILRLAGEPRNSLSAAAADTLLSELVWYYGSEQWRAGAIDVLIDGGRLQAIQDPDLRQLLASWRSALDRVRSIEQIEGVYFDDVLMPYLRAHASVPQIADLAQVLPGTDLEPGYGRTNWVLEQRDHREMLRSDEFQNVVLQKLWIHVDVLSAYEEFSSGLDELIRRLESQLAS